MKHKMKHIKKFAFYGVPIAFMEGMFGWIIIRGQEYLGLWGTVGFIILGLVSGFFLVLTTLYVEDELRDVDRTAKFLLRQEGKSSETDNKNNMG